MEAPSRCLFAAVWLVHSIGLFDGEEALAVRCVLSGSPAKGGLGRMSRVWAAANSPSVWKLRSDRFHSVGAAVAAAVDHSRSSAHGAVRSCHGFGPNGRSPVWEDGAIPRAAGSIYRRRKNEVEARRRRRRLFGVIRSRVA